MKPPSSLRTIPRLSLFAGLCLFLLPPLAHAQNFEARVQMQTGDILEVTIRPRRPGTTILEMERTDRAGIIAQPIADIRRIHFDLGDIDSNAVTQLYYMGKHEEVLGALGGQINPYIAFSDLETNSNELVMMFIRSLYHTGNYRVVVTASERVARFATRGTVRELADVYETLARIKLGGEPEELAALARRLPKPNLLDPHAPAIWYGHAITALSSNDWKNAYLHLAKIITEAPMNPEWVGEALYLTATYHHNISTNLMVANQICQEIMIVAPETPWATQAEARMINIAEDAEKLGVTLTAFGEFRDREREAGDAAIDYRQRQRELREEAARQRLEALE